DDAALMAASLAQQLVADAAAGAVKGKTLAVARFANRSEDEDINPVVLQEKLITALVKARWCKVVERERLDRALAQLKLDAAGLTDPATRKQLGKLLSADYLLLGSVAGQVGRITADAHLLAIESGEIVLAADYPPKTQRPGTATDARIPPAADIVTDDADAVVRLQAWSSAEVAVTSSAWERGPAKRGAVRWLVEQEILRDAEDVLEAWRPEITARIYAKADSYVLEIVPREDAYYLRLNLTHITRELVSITFGKITPRVAVLTTEQILTRPAPDPAVQTAINAALLQYGFQVVDVAQAKAAKLRESLLQAESGDARAVNLVRQAAGELDADLFALGESFAQQRERRDGFDARVEYRLVEGATARLLASIAQDVSLTRAEEPKLDPASLVLAKRALQRAAERTAPRMAAEMLKSFGKPVYRLRVWKIGSYDNREKIIQGLKDALGGATVTATTFDLRGTNSAVFAIGTKRDADSIARALRAIPGLKIKVTEIACRSLVAEVE
ncbi:MAG TPA: CsgG/HfaB family protein, partial [Armatimonadota bacterium]|nr:CsgG/HfaB family protein [Armatimonadota bacterium]